ncbi:MAG: diacylglycerol kinase [Gammaproteobacteria bacterium]|nr:MAG: diacylglycerol kinase [Gammaproteobacteria bacterium]
MKNRPFPERLKAALQGLREAWRTERSLRTQSLFALAALLALPILRPALIWWALVGVMVILVLAAELFNTALEHLADHLHPERHPRIRLVKDCAAGAVLLLCLAALWVAALMVLSVL